MTGSAPGARQADAFALLARARGLRPVGPSHLDRTLRGLAAFFAQAALRDSVVRRPGLLQGIDPRARLGALLLFLVSVSLTSSIPALAMHALLPALALALSRVRLREVVGSGLGVAAVFALLIAAPAACNLVVEGAVLAPWITFETEWRFGPYLLPRVIGPTWEGLLGAVTFLLRVLSSVAAVLWLALSTAWIDLLGALRAVGIPALIVQVVGMTVRYLFALQRMIEEAYLGRKSRAVCRMPAGRERAFVASRVGHTWERSVVLMTEVGEAMTARGFTGEIRSLRPGRLGGREWGLLAATILGCGVAHVL